MPSVPKNRIVHNKTLFPWAMTVSAIERTAISPSNRITLALLIVFPPDSIFFILLCPVKRVNALPFSSKYVTHSAKMPLTNPGEDFIILPKAMTKRDGIRRPQRTGGRCKPAARGSRSYGFRAEGSRAVSVVRASPRTAALRRRGCWTPRVAFGRKAGAI